jgi:dTDP-4-dehydrorhamnose 3,5-epimerase
MIDGVKIVPKKQILDERGAVYHFMRCDSPEFERFGEVYFSWIYPGVIKGWHRHRMMTLNYVVPAGRIKLVLYDDRPASPTCGELEEFFLGECNYQLVQVPPLVWNGFKGIGAQPALVANCATYPHHPAEIERLDPFSTLIPYTWELRHG